MKQIKKTTRPARVRNTNRRSRDVAIFLSGLPESQLTEVLSQLPLEQAQAITETITGLGEVSELEKQQVTDRFRKEAGFEIISRGSDRKYRVDGSHKSARDVSPSQRFAKKPADALTPLELNGPSEQEMWDAIDFVEARDFASVPQAFEFCATLSIRQLTAGLADEDPQSIATVLAHIEKSMAAKILTSFDIDWRMAIVRRMANLPVVSESSKSEIALRIKSRINESPGESSADSNGLRKVSEIFGELDSTTRQTLIDCLTVSDLTLARKLSQKCLTMDDVIRLSDHEIKLTLAAIDTSVLAPALVDCRELTRQKVFKNMAEAAANLLREEIEAFRPDSPNHVRDAQQKMLEAIARVRESHLANKAAA